LQHKNDINYNYIQEDEIDIKDLIRILLRNIKKIFFITILVTTLAIVYIFVKAPTYEVRSNISIGNYSGSFIESPEVLIARTIIVHMENVQKEEIGVLKAVNLKKGTSNIIEFVVQSDTNQNAIKKLDNILQEIFAFHEEKITKYKNFNNDEIE
jgi:LPS O-antigen subunit length determinant protein (WzzB/FepE family)